MLWLKNLFCLLIILKWNINFYYSVLSRFFINLKGDQINELNSNLNTLKSNDSSLFGELQAKTEQFVAQLANANSEIAQLKIERDELISQRKQFEFVLEEKTRESAQLKSEVQMHVQHLAAQSQALEKLQEDLKLAGEEKQQRERTVSEQQSATDQAAELETLKAQYNELYVYVEKKNEVCMIYLNI